MEFKMSSFKNTNHAGTELSLEQLSDVSGGFYIDDWCGTIPKLPFPWPVPPRPWDNLLNKLGGLQDVGGLQMPRHRIG